MSHIDILAIGDTVTDAFIELEVGHTQTHDGVEEYCLPFGSKLPYKNVTVVPGVGNSANASVCAARLGLSTSLVSFLGNDSDGLLCLRSLRNEGVDTTYITQEDGKKTNYHYVLWHGAERTILVKHEAFTSHLPEIIEPSFIYLSSLGAHTLPLHEEIIAYVQAHPEVKLAFQPGTFQLSLGTEKLSELYKLSYALCMNKEEAQTFLNSQETDVAKLISMLAEYGSRITLITDGPHGSYMQVDGKTFSVPLYPDIAPPLERTGAGDAFFATFISYLAKGMSPEDALLRAPINSMNVVQHIGAQVGLLSEQEIEKYLKKAPAEYKVKSL
jgi:sugar/nucleoside kinase (ribokinase family)